MNAKWKRDFLGGGDELMLVDEATASIYGRVRRGHDGYKWIAYRYPAREGVADDPDEAKEHVEESLNGR